MFHFLYFIENRVDGEHVGDDGRAEVLRVACLAGLYQRPWVDGQQECQHSPHNQGRHHRRRHPLGTRSATQEHGSEITSQSPH
ncbi:hypothetical protein E2C01_037473 [Portunus trituberculatus]|uniref:Uncharacterized protein n=1 Tax=Portunus trituberculatus TaxID=210409 RepID=A0A5B7FFQ7_PORTR|nr:hypothetical protein [Portunus trituberculatus]